MAVVDEGLAGIPTEASARVKAIASQFARAGADVLENQGSKTRTESIGTNRLP